MNGFRNLRARVVDNIDAGRLNHLATAMLCLVIFFVGFSLGNAQSVSNAQGNFIQPPDTEEAFAPFWQAYSLIQSQYIDEVDMGVLVDGALTGMLDALEDQYSGYMTPETYDLLNADLEGEIEGIGVVIRTNEETNLIEVVSLLEGAPAQEAGILPGDIFAAVDGEDVTGMNQLELAALVRGPEGSEVTITMQRGDELVDFTIERERIIIPNVETDVFEEENIAYVRLNQFSPNIREELDAALDTVAVDERDGLILDLRDNPGGLLSSAIEIGSAFIEEGPIVIEDFGNGEETTLEANGDFANIDVPIVLLVNESSASASELIAGALQDAEVATIIGETTLGKGTVQTWSQLVNGGGVRLTIARWLTPEGRWIHEQGITPDIVIEWTPETYAPDEFDPQLDAAINFIVAPETVVSNVDADSEPVR